MMRRALSAPVLLAPLFAALVAASPALGEETDSPLARITYVTSRSVYIDAGSEKGILAGQILEIVREEEDVATLRVTEVTSQRAVCEILEGSEATPAVEDTVRLARGAAEEAANDHETSEVEPEASAPRRSVGEVMRAAGLRGRVGIRYLVVRDRMEDGEGFSQPALDLRLDGRQVGGAPVDFSVDVRARRTYRDLPDGGSDSDDLNRVYSLSGSWRRPGNPWSATAGRQFSPSLAVISIFDGARLDYNAGRWGAGAFTGTQPDAEDFGYSSDVREHGGYFEWRSAPGSARRWALTTGLVGSYEEGEINREFSFLQVSYRGPRLFAWLGEEVDLNRGWKEDAGEDSVSLTSTYLSLNYRASDAWTFRGGYDNRRNVRLYRDRVTPETEFDDDYRNGAWIGAAWRFAQRFRLGLDMRTRGGGDLGGADGYTLTFGADRLTAANLFVHTRSTRYENDLVEGWLHSVSTGLALGQRWHVALLGGLRDETNLVNPLLDDEVFWAGAEIDVFLGAGWTLFAYFEGSDGDTEEIAQAYVNLAYRF